MLSFACPIREVIDFNDILPCIICAQTILPHKFAYSRWIDDS